MRTGAFQTSREIFDNPIWQDIPKFRIFFYILGNAVFSEEGVRKGNLTINRGQYLRSYRNLSDDLEFVENRKIKKYSISVISRKIDQLVKEERLKIEDTELGTLFTVVNYDEYQGFDRYKKELGTELEQGWNTDGTGMEQHRNNNNNVKNVKNEKKKESSPKRVYDEESDPYIIAEFFVKEIRKNFNEFKTPNMQKWSDDIRKLLEINGKDKKRVCEIIRLVQQDSFWFKNCLSPSKLREKFSELEVKFLSAPKVNVKQHQKENAIKYNDFDLEGLMNND